MLRLLLSFALVPMAAAQFFGAFNPAKPREVPFSQLGTATDGHWRWCPDCASTTPCTGGGSGAHAYAVGGQWRCTSSSGGSASWGGITGTLGAQTDLAAALAAKQAANAILDVLAAGCASGQIPFYTGSTAACSFGTPSDGQILKWSAANARWEAAANAAEAVQSWQDSETPSGTLDGVNANFSLLSPPSPAGSLLVWKNGLLQKVTVDYTLAGSTITFQAGSIPQAGDILTATYRTLTGAPGDPVTSVNGQTGAVTLSPAGDVTGTLGAMIVSRLQGRDVFNAAPTDGQVLSWSAANSRWQPTTLTPAGDVTGTLGAMVVSRLQGRDVFDAAPTDGQVLSWSAANSRWQPTTSAGGGSSHNPLAANIHEDFCSNYLEGVTGNGDRHFQHIWRMDASNVTLREITVPVNHPCVLRADINASTAGTISLTLSRALGGSAGGGFPSLAAATTPDWQAHFVARISHNTNVRFMVGFSSSTSPIDGVGGNISGFKIEFDTERSAPDTINFRYRVCNLDSCVGAADNSSVAVTGGAWYVFRFRKVGSSIGMSISADGGLTYSTEQTFCSSGCTYTATPTTIPLSPLFYFAGDASESVSRQMHIDMVDLHFDSDFTRN